MSSFAAYILRVILRNTGFGRHSLSEHLAIHAEWKRQLSSRQSPLELELPWITLIVERLIRRHLEIDCARRGKVFEFGSGGSSVYLRRRAAEVVTVEHDPEWFQKVNDCAESTGMRMRGLFLVEPERVQLTGGDVSDPSTYRSADPPHSASTFKTYASFIDQYPESYFDLVIVDGRSRPSCLVHAMPRIRVGGLLVLDNAEREYYLRHVSIDPLCFYLV